MSWGKDFKEFALKGNALDLAVGVVIGTAFGAIVSAIEIPASGTNGRTSSAPTRGWTPRWRRRSISSTARAASASAAASTHAGAPRKENTVRW